MPEILRDLASRGVYAAEDLAALQSIYLAVCTRLDIRPDDPDGRRIIAKAVLFAFDRGARDVERLKSAAVGASRTPLLERDCRNRPPTLPDAAADDRKKRVAG
ncbi:hypothetical protein [Phreatobacter sp. AB_2022a]|uniref:hypothetical protein n=1 Tax=Phreatobacter sp. AB_2022a TaxID=3003134 RepID=UPI0022874031|nr:hypothetical protein [Phreatobacter sp. AB_2022a]MCZ0738397.1 hypothetical protein [Phreatobacter sp. AB_2022a]